MKYTKEQLIKGMAEYYKQVAENPEGFEQQPEDNFEEAAEETIDYLLNIINKKDGGSDFSSFETK